MSEIRFLTFEEILAIHKAQIEEFGGAHGLRDEGLLDSAIITPQMGFGDVYFHDSLYKMAGAYFYHIIKNHPFIDGNKRTGVVVTLIFLHRNGVEINLSSEVLFDLAIGIANSKYTKDSIAELLEKSNY